VTFLPVVERELRLAAPLRPTQVRAPDQNPRTRSRTCDPKALAIFTRESTVGDSFPRSIRLIKTVERPAFSASFSWLRSPFLRLERIVSPRRRRYSLLTAMTS
jgi:hypothetical protein